MTIYIYKNNELFIINLKMCNINKKLFFFLISLNLILMSHVINIIEIIC